MLNNKSRKPCAECPFARHCEPGFTGGSDPTVFIGQTFGPFRLDCHMTPNYRRNKHDLGNPECAGAAIYRANTKQAERQPLALLRLPANHELVFSSPTELLAHHKQITLPIAELMLKLVTPAELYVIELGRAGVEYIRPRLP